MSANRAYVGEGCGGERPGEARGDADDGTGGAIAEDVSLDVDGGLVGVAGEGV